MILHITPRADWLRAQAAGEYRAASLDSEGFIHCSTEQQVVTVANAFYRDAADLVLLMIDAAQLKPQLKWEPPAGPPADAISASDLFPHIYGAINLDAVSAIVDLRPDSAGMYTLPSLT